MCLVAITTVEIYPANDSAQVLRSQLEKIRLALNHHSDCAAYTLTCGAKPSDAWILSGYWDSTERMAAHFKLPYLGQLFELAAQRQIARLCFGTFYMAPVEVAI